RHAGVDSARRRSRSKGICGNDLWNPPIRQFGSGQRRRAVDSPELTPSHAIGSTPTAMMWSADTAADLRRDRRAQVELAAWSTIVVLALFSRLIGLEWRAMSHDESIHALFAYRLYESATYRHDPAYHGPLL